MCPSVWASPWGQSPASALTIRRVDEYHAKSANRAFEENSLNIYREAGIADGVTVGAQLILGQQRVRRNGTVTAENDGVLVATAFVQKQVFNHGSHVMAVRSSATPVAGLRFGGPGIQGEKDARAGLSGHYGWSNGISFATVSAGYEIAFGNDPDSWHVSVEAGRHVGDAILLAGYNGRHDTNGLAPDLAPQTLGTMSASVVMPLGPIYRLQLGARRDVLATGIDPGTGLFGALWVTP